MLTIIKLEQVRGRKIIKTPLINLIIISAMPPLKLELERKCLSYNLSML